MRATIPILLVALCVVEAPCAPAQQVRLSSRPLLTIGGTSDPNTEFTHIVDVVRLSTGEVAVVNFGGSSDIRLFSPSGKFLKLLARPGSGPGEIGTLYWTGRAGDSLLTYDLSLRRITVYDVPREAVASTRFAPQGGPPGKSVTGRLPDGDWLVLAGLMGTPNQAVADGPSRDTVSVGLVSRDGVSEFRAFARIPYVGRFNYSRAGRASGRFDPLIPFPSFLVVGDHVWIGDGATGQISLYDGRGTLVRHFAAPLAPRPYSRDAVGQWLHRMLGAATTAADSEAIAASVDLSRRPAAGPAFSKLIRGARGAVWIEAYREDGSGSTEYVMVSENGFPGKRFVGPSNVRFFEIGTDYALGVMKDRDDVETVVMYGILP